MNDSKKSRRQTSGGPVQVGQLLGDDFLGKLAPQGRGESEDDAVGGREVRRVTKEQRIERAIDNLTGILSGDVHEREALGFIGRLLVQATFPHSKPEGNEWVRANGDVKLYMLAPSEVGLPYGTYPRLLMVWLTQEACRNKADKSKTAEEARRIDLGHSLSSFMGELGLLPTGGRWGTIPRIKDQMDRLFSTAIYLRKEQGDEDGNQRGRRAAQQLVANDSELWWDVRRPAQDALFRSWVLLSQPFFDLITDGPVPIDMDVLRHIKKSPMAIDIYWWATHRLSYLKRTTTIPWPALMAQFGANYPDTPQGRRNFRKKFLKGFALVQQAWPALQATSTEAGLKLPPGAPSVRKLR